MGSLVRNTAVPGTRAGGRFSSIATRSASGNSSLRDFSNRSRLPRRHVYIRMIMSPPSASGTQPPSNTLSRFAARKVRSRHRNGAISAAAASGDHRDQQQLVDARDEDLAGMDFRGMANFEARQQPELDRLARQRIGAGDDG